MTATSNTETITQLNSGDSEIQNSILKLRLSNNDTIESGEHQVRFSEETVDNENMNRKKTKICCIYHPEENECEHNHENEIKGDDKDDDIVSSDEEDAELSYTDRRAKRIDRRKKELAEKESEAYVPSNSYEIQPDYSSKSVS
ncbi:hypothetical protein QEN19_003870 [Hanseniaspora menglaensis]